MARPLRMPPLGTTSDELRIVEWLKAEGDEVALGEPLLAVETDKATLEVEAASAGTLLRIVHAAGAVVDTGDVVAYVGEPGEEVPSEPEAEDRPAAAPEGSPVRPPRSAQVTASPAVRRLAAERGIDLSQVRGSGPGGRVEKRDLTGVLEGAVAEGELVPRHREALARRLSRAAAIPQFSVGVTVDMTLAATQLERERAAGLAGLTYTHLLLRSVATALRSHPEMNVVWIDEGPRRRSLERPDVGLAVAGDDALLVVTIGEPDRLSLAELVEQSDLAAAEARSGRLSERFGGRAALTLSNLGMVGVDRFTAIVDPDQTAILAAGAVVERPGATAAGVGLVPQLELTLTADHRAVDGVVAGRFLVAVRSLLEGGEI
ncbi:MAG TPA: dihydrolipoamide acetyltransferase family protein [Gaiellaceae bacterium]|nr:dihydrolipoamide acetyltransferase family protein [Gaiellaceae bacterium]